MDNQTLIAHLEDVYNYDFIYEVLHVSEIGGRVRIEYRGTNGEYDYLWIESTLDKLLGALL